MAANRGLSQSSQPTPAEIEREVYRQSRTSGAKTRSASQPRRSLRNGNANGNGNGRRSASGAGKSAAAQKTKAKNLKKKQQEAKKENVPLVPSKKAANAAKKALKDAGFSAPKGMKMVISYVSADNNTSNKNNANAKGNKKNNNQKKNQQQQQQPKKNNNQKKNQRSGRR